MSPYRATRSWLAMCRQWTREQGDVDHRRVKRIATDLMHVPKGLPVGRRRRGSVWAISIVRNEADVVGLTIEHHLRQGVDAILIADNGSTDGTLDILHEFAREYPVYVVSDSWPVWDQAVKTTLLANVARRAGADWIMPFDADEFWFAPGASVAEHLRRSSANVAQAHMYNLFPLHASHGHLSRDSSFRFDLSPHALRKIAFRSHPMASVQAGNHYVFRSGPRESGLRIAHLPWRSLEQMQRKVGQGNSAIVAAGLPSSVGGHWRLLAGLGTDELLALWRQIADGEPADGTCWSPVGPFLEIEPLSWRSWDPDGHLVADDVSLGQGYLPSGP